MWIIPLCVIVLKAVLFVASPAFLIRYMIILRKCNNLHPNCKLFMLGIGMALILPVLVSMVDFLIEIVNYVHEIDDELLHSFHHCIPPMYNASFGMTSFLFFSMAIERLYACVNAARYPSHLQTFALIGLSISVIGSTAFVYADEAEYFPIPIFFILSSFDILALVLCIFAILWSFYRLRTTEYVLNYRVQLTEVIQASKCVLPALILGVPIKISEPLLALHGIETTSGFHSVIFLVYSILVPFTIMVCNREMRGHFIPCCRPKVAEANNKKKDSEKYFNHFNRTIDVKKKQVRQSPKVNTYTI